MVYRSSVTLLCLLSLILEVTDVFALSPPPPRACIIGAGYSGLATARYMKEYGVNFTVFEASKYVGGTWRFDPHVGVDEDGIPLFTSMYKNLRTNTPRQTMEYPGFPFPEDTPSYPTGPCFYKYLQAFAKHFKLLEDIQLQTYVTLVKWVGDLWHVAYTKTDTKENFTEPCDFVVIASGEFSSPSIPDIDGLEKYKGKVIHSHDYKDPEAYRNKTVLLVGAGASGLDLAMHLSNVTSKLIHSHHLNYNQPEFSKTYVRKPDIDSFTENGAIFVDGSQEEFENVIFCTGYNYAHPFLDESSGLTASQKFILPLYQHTVNIKHPSMTFVGISKKVINRVMDAQGQYAAALVSGKFALPTQQTMLRNWLEHVYTQQNAGLRIVDVNVISDMDAYFSSLTQEADVTPAPPVLTKIARFNAKNRLDDLLNYRDYDYKIIDNHNYERRYNRRKEQPCPVNVDV